MRRSFSWLLCLLLALPFGGAEAALQSAQPASFAWMHAPQTSGKTVPADIIITKDGGVFVAGSTDTEDMDYGAPLGGTDALVMRLDSEGNVVFSARFGGSGEDVFTKVLEMPDGGCVLLGTTTSTDGDAKASRGGVDAFVVRLDPRGETRWIKCIGGTLDDELLSIVLGDDGNLFACGRTKSRNGDLRANLGGWDAFATVLSDAEGGKPLWIVRYGQAGDDQFMEALSLPSGWLVLGEIAEETVGSTADAPMYRERPVALLLSETGEEVFHTTLGGSGTNKLTSVLRTDTGFMFLGHTNSSSVLMPAPRGGMDIWQLHLREAGSVSLQRTFGGSGDDLAHSMLQGESGTVYMLGSTRSSDGQVYGSHGDKDVWVLAVTATGGLKWQQALGGSGTETPAGICRAPNAGFYVAGTTTSQDGDFSAHEPTQVGFLATLTPNGNLDRMTVVDSHMDSRIHRLVGRDGNAFIVGSFYAGDAEQLFVCRVGNE